MYTALWLTCGFVFASLFIEWGKVLRVIYRRWLGIVVTGSWFASVFRAFVVAHPLNYVVRSPSNRILVNWCMQFFHSPMVLVGSAALVLIYAVLLLSRVLFPLTAFFTWLSYIQKRTLLRWKYSDPVKEKSNASRPSPVTREPSTNWDSGVVTKRQLGRKFKPNTNAMKSIIGASEVLQVIRTAVEIPIRAPKLVKEYNYRGFSGLLMYGPPGNGKTAIARAVAESLGLYFIHIQPSSVMGTLVGATEQHIRNAFEEAKQHAPAIIFIDEIDSLGRARGSTANPYSDSFLTELLVQLDGFETRGQVFVLAATNRVDVLDPALLRPGRFDRKVYVPNPDAEARATMWWTWTRDLPLADDIYPREVSIWTEGSSGADMKGLADRVRELVVERAWRRQQPKITREDIVRIVGRDNRTNTDSESVV